MILNSLTLTEMHIKRLQDVEMFPLFCRVKDFVHNAIRSCYSLICYKCIMHSGKIAYTPACLEMLILIVNNVLFSGYTNIVSAHVTRDDFYTCNRDCEREAGRTSNYCLSG